MISPKFLAISAAIVLFVSTLIVADRFAWLPRCGTQAAYLSGKSLCIAWPKPGSRHFGPSLQYIQYRPIPTPPPPPPRPPRRTVP